MQPEVHTVWLYLLLPSIIGGWCIIWFFYRDEPSYRRKCPSRMTVLGMTIIDWEKTVIKGKKK